MATDPFLMTFVYIAVFIIALSFAGMGLKFGADKLKLWVDRKNLESHERAQKAEPLPNYGGSPMRHSGKK